MIMMIMVSHIGYVVMGDNRKTYHISKGDGHPIDSLKNQGPVKQCKH